MLQKSLKHILYEDYDDLRILLFDPEKVFGKRPVFDPEKVFESGLCMILLTLKRFLESGLCMILKNKIIPKALDDMYFTVHLRFLHPLRGVNWKNLLMTDNGMIKSI